VIGTRLAILGIAVVVLVIALVAGAAGQALHDLLRAHRRVEPRARRSRRPATSRFTPERTHLRPYSPEILAIVLLALAAGLWLSRLLR